MFRYPAEASEELKLYIGPPKKKRVLLVEDEPLVLLAERNMLKKLDCEVDEATNGEIAIKKVCEKNKSDSTKYDLILMDINMPVMNGYIASKTITELVSKGNIRETPIVCLSAQESSEHQVKCTESGIIELSIVYLFF